MEGDQEADTPGEQVEKPANVVDVVAVVFEHPPEVMVSLDLMRVTGTEHPCCSQPGDAPCAYGAPSFRAHP
jgi:hypothetical protein